MEKTSTSIRILKAEPGNFKDKSLVVGFFKGNIKVCDELKEFESLISSYIKDNDFKGEKGEVRSIYINKNVKNIILAGLGEEEKYSLDILTNSIGDISKKLRDVLP